MAARLLVPLSSAAARLLRPLVSADPVLVRHIAPRLCGRAIVFAGALSESTHHLRNSIAFRNVPVTEALGGYIYALWFGVGFCVLRFVTGAVFFSGSRG